ncbi:substrate-binding periplasmic protein [Pseudoalteromonas sp. SSDWG2]|uniref:substrate-binding periplasmic protein n=1 Tax=Pseudoalteromonas sp. SSDWG2 TaxID=3139391 RepID=UPI003BADA2EE
MMLRIMCVLLLLGSWGHTLARDINGGYPNHFPPFSIAQEQVTGIIPDLLSAMNEYGGPRYYAAPYANNPVKLLSEGQLDFIFDSQRWSDNVEHYYWSEPITHISDILVVNKDSKINANSLDEFFALARAMPVRLGVKYMYVYPTLNEAMTNETLLRRNYYTEYALLDELKGAHGQVLDAVVMSRLVYQYLVLNNAEFANAFRILEFDVDSAPYQFRFPKTRDGKLNWLFTNELISKLKSDGVIEGIVKTYVHTPQDSVTD